LAQIDLKNTTISIRDGYSVGPAPKVNNIANYTTGATTMLVDGITGAVQVGNEFTVTGSTATHKITAHTETTGNTTSITFTPGLTGAVLDNAVITFKPHSIEIKLGEGTLSYDEKRKVEYVLDRGKLDTTRLGDEEGMDIRLDFIWEFITAVSASGVPTPEDALKKRGEASTWVSSSTDLCEPYSVDILIENVPPCTGDYSENITLPDFRYESLAHDAKAGTIAVTGKCNAVEAIIERIAPV
jgi:hypothetical protein